MQRHNLKPKTARIKSQAIGRGGKRGKTSGRGTKGQKARAGHRMRPELRDIIKKLPKLRGYRFPSITNKPAVVEAGRLQVFKAGTEVTPAKLLEAGLIKRLDGKLPPVKILAGGELKAALTIVGCLLSAAARSQIEAAGGSVK